MPHTAVQAAHTTHTQMNFHVTLPTFSHCKSYCTLLTILLLHSVHTTQGFGAEKQLPVGHAEVFDLQGHEAFLILPDNPARKTNIPWVWYAPTLPGLPSQAEKWMFERFLASGIAIAGIDVGESYGSPAGTSLYSAFHQELTQQRGLATQACLLARSRGGLMLYNWASENPSNVRCIAGIYPVCNLTSYPGIPKASPAYGLSSAELEANSTRYNPVDRLAPLANAKVPIFHIHGDSDRVVPLEQNSKLLFDRYIAMHGPMQLEVVPGQGHNMWVGWFQSQKLVEFVIRHATRE